MQDHRVHILRDGAGDVLDRALQMLVRGLDQAPLALDRVPAALGEPVGVEQEEVPGGQPLGQRCLAPGQRKADPPPRASR